MTLEQLRDELDLWSSVEYRMRDEGMEYCFRSYSNFLEIKDEEFHRRREKLIELMVEMKEYVQQKITEVEDRIIETDED